MRARVQIPQLSSFLVISTIVQVPILIYFTFVQDGIVPFDRCAGGLSLAATVRARGSGAPAALPARQHSRAQVAEMVLAVLALRRMIERQTAAFYQMCQEEGSDDEGAEAGELPGDEGWQDAWDYDGT